MIVVTSDVVPGKTIKQSLGLVQGDIVLSKNIGSDILAGVRNLVGGEVKGYTEMMDRARQTAIDRMVKEAKALDADAIIGMRFSSSAIMGGASEMLAYGTAVKLK